MRSGSVPSRWRMCAPTPREEASVDPSSDEGGFGWSSDPWHAVHEVTVTSTTPSRWVGPDGFGVAARTGRGRRRQPRPPRVVGRRCIMAPAAGDRLLPVPLRRQPAAPRCAVAVDVGTLLRAGIPARGDGRGAGVVDGEPAEVDDCRGIAARVGLHARGRLLRQLVARSAAVGLVSPVRARVGSRGAVAAVARRAPDWGPDVAAGLAATDADRAARVVLPVALLARGKREAILGQVLRVKGRAAPVGPALGMDASRGSRRTVLGTTRGAQQGQDDERRDEAHGVRAEQRAFRRHPARGLAEYASPSPRRKLGRRKMCVDAKNSPGCIAVGAGNVAGTEGATSAPGLLLRPPSSHHHEMLHE